MANQASIKHSNGRQILDLLRIEGATTRAEISRRLGMTRSAITYQIEDLVRRQLVCEMEPVERQKSDIGRPGIGVALNSSGGHFLGVEIGVGIMRFAIVDLALVPVIEEAVSFDLALSPAEVVQLIVARLGMMQKNLAVPIRGVGLTLPGLVRKNGFVVHLPILGWRDVNFAPVLDDAFSVPWTLSNNANAAAFGHSYSFPEPQTSMLLFLKLGTGCGGAIVADGRLQTGPDGLAGEFGHIRIAGDGPICSCGKIGCLETRVNLRALEQYLGRVLDGHQIEKLAASGELTGHPAMTTYLAHLSLGLADLVNSLNPDAILLGGMLAPLLRPNVERLAAGVAANVVPGLTVPPIGFSRLGVFECAIGAAALAHQASLDNAEAEWQVLISIAAPGKA
ncbi:N-acetylglucosamine repressor [Devosia sp. UYZn731]|uniref:ROK family transcriptional regulator n=1 Tax=Devosia sp. UYZn731 TaxID=3156345 RepID=UPI0033924790